MARREFLLHFSDTYACSQLLMLFQKFELILIKIDFFMNFNAAPKFGKIPCTIVQGILPKVGMRKYSIFITFSDTYACSHVVLKI